jgi:hypothetical protein
MSLFLLICLENIQKLFICIGVVSVPRLYLVKILDRVVEFPWASMGGPLNRALVIVEGAQE